MPDSIKLPATRPERSDKEYAQVKAASLLPRDAQAWEPFVRDVLSLPLSMLPEVQEVVSRKTWMLAKDPVRQVRIAAMNLAGRAVKARVISANRNDQWERIQSLIADCSRLKSRIPGEASFTGGR